LLNYIFNPLRVDQAQRTHLNLYSRWIRCAWSTLLLFK